MIPCKLLPLEKTYHKKDIKTEKRYGIYVKQQFWSIDGVGKTCWPVVVNIAVDYDEYLKEGLTEEEIVLKCIEFLNYRQKSKYGRKRRRKPLYGTFRDDITPPRFKLKEKDGIKIIQTILAAKEQKNSKFWGEGKKENIYKCRRR
jgi:hypothetical protein